MSLPRITVVTPSYNQAKYIRSTIDSVLSQNYPNLEYIVMDGGSTDETLEILRSYRNKFKWFSKRDHGQTDAINQGLKLGSGEILAYLNSDDVYLPGTLKRVGEYYSRTHADWITGDCLIIDSLGRPTKSNWLIAGYKRFLMMLYSRNTLMIADSMLPQPSTFWSRKAWNRVGNFNEKYHYVMDYDYWLRLSRYYRPYDLKIALSGFRTQPESKSETSRAKLMAEGEISLVANGAKPWQVYLHRFHSGVVRMIYNLIKN